MSGPLSVPIPDSLRRRLSRHAKKHHLKMATAARSLIDERLTELEKGDQLGRAESWQREQVWQTLERIDREGARYVSRESVHGLIHDAIARVKKRKRNGRSS